MRGESTCPALDGAHWPDLLSFLPLLTRTPKSKRHSCPCSRPCQLPFPATVPPHSPVPSQASVVSGPLHSVSLPLPMPMALATLPPPQPPPPATSPGPQLGPDALAIVERAQQMVEILTEENRALHQELQAHCESSEKLHKVLTGRGPAFLHTQHCLGSCAHNHGAWGTRRGADSKGSGPQCLNAWLWRCPLAQSHLPQREGCEVQMEGGCSSL